MYEAQCYNHNDSEKFYCCGQPPSYICLFCNKHFCGDCMYLFVTFFPLIFFAFGVVFCAKVKKIIVPFVSHID